MTDHPLSAAHRAHLVTASTPITNTAAIRISGTSRVTAM